MTEHSIHDLEPQLAANRRFWTGWAEAAPDVDLPIYRSNIPHALFNGVMRARDVPLGEAIAEAKRRLAGSSWSWWVGDDSDDGVAEHLLAHGARETTLMPIMAVDLTDVVEAPAPEGLAIRHVTDRPGLRELVCAYAGPLGFPESGIDRLVESKVDYLARDPQLIHLAGVVDGKTVGTSVVSLGADVAALYCIATDEAYRRRGVATALTLESLRVAREAGHDVATLQASSMGRPVYERIGFTTVSHYRLFGFDPADETGD
ncbi:GNAT family N-acetyltransferase [Actinoallomurus acaciae]|uniref:GNAT family N-acetyltransferase n=1 Tax=Actinoallomurus acaciae TaxID=502577 RepID=A0ABV5Y8C2_9ACTN